MMSKMASLGKPPGDGEKKSSRTKSQQISQDILAKINSKRPNKHKTKSKSMHNKK
jgi:hypothetical protein